MVLCLPLTIVWSCITPLQLSLDLVTLAFLLLQSLPIGWIVPFGAHFIGGFTYGKGVPDSRDFGLNFCSFRLNPLDASLPRDSGQDYLIIFV